jgi:hypothetical protein
VCGGPADVRAGIRAQCARARSSEMLGPVLARDRVRRRYGLRRVSDRLGLRPRRLGKQAHLHRSAAALQRW